MIFFYVAIGWWVLLGLSIWADERATEDEAAEVDAAILRAYEIPPPAVW